MANVPAVYEMSVYAPFIIIYALVFKANLGRNVIPYFYCARVKWAENHVVDVNSDN